MAKSRIKVPKSARKGEVVQIKTLISHRMESGQRKDKEGKLVPRWIINQLVCTYNGEEVFRADLHPAVAANPFVSFHTVATESGTLEFTWRDDDGTVYTNSATIEVR